MEKITDSIVVYQDNTMLLKGAIDSFLKSTMTGPLMIIDNSPSDELRHTCTCPGVTYIFNNRNLGYGKGHNQAIRQFLNRSQYHLVLNPDVSFAHDVIEKLILFMENNPQAGLAMPQGFGAACQLQTASQLFATPLALAPT